MDMEKFAYFIFLAFFLFFIFGCSSQTIAKSEYDELKLSCDSYKRLAEQEIAFEKQKNYECRSQLSDCNDAKKANEELMAIKNIECEKLLASVAVLKQAREAADSIEKYRNLSALYNDAYGPGKVLNTAKIRRIESQLAAINNTVLSSDWKRLKNCSTISECDAAKSKFQSTINQSINLIALEVVDIIKKND